MPLETSISFAVLLTLVVISAFVEADSFDEFTFNLLVTKLRNDTFELAREVERLYERRCDVETMKNCQNANYGECRKDYPSQQCMEGPSFAIDACSSGASECFGLWDFSVSTVRYPEEKADGVERNPADPSLIESICFTKDLDIWFKDKYETDKAYWEKIGFEPPSMYFGSHTGAFRIFPARQSEECGKYDPRVRPWYVAGSSGPKNIVLILDVSKSMDNDNRISSRISNLKVAAKRVVSTLTVSDRVLIVPFSTNATAITDKGFVFIATDENKEKLKKIIDNLNATGKTNYYDGFLKAFDALETSINGEYTAGCNTAILFLTDGETTDGPELEEVTELVNSRITRLSGMLRKPVLLFTYSVSEALEGVVHIYPRQLACSTELGVWSKITHDEEIVDALSNYYQLFALGLGSDINQDFAAWVEPYPFATGKTLGTTVSVPVFDRTKTPSLFLGVVGINIPLDPLDAALATKDATSVVPGSKRAEELRAESIRRIVEKSGASCPNIDISPCVLEAYRNLSSTTQGEGLCGVNCTGFEIKQVQADKCLAVSDYPKRIMVDPEEAPGSYPGRVCCQKGETTASESCAKEDTDGPPVGIIVGVVVSGLFCVMLVLLGVSRYRKRAMAAAGKPKDHHGKDNSAQTSPTNPAWSPGDPTNPIPPPLQFATAPCCVSVPDDDLHDLRALERELALANDPLEKELMLEEAEEVLKKELAQVKALSEAVRGGRI